MYERFSEKVYNTALSYLQNDSDAEETTQDIFVTIFNKAHTFQGKAALSTWIYRLTVNSSLNLLKKRKRHTFFQRNASKEDPAGFEHPGVLLENKEKTQHIFKAIDKLPETQKTAFILSFVEELPRQEVADIMETSLKAVESLLQRAKGNLRVELKFYKPSEGNG